MFKRVHAVLRRTGQGIVTGNFSGPEILKLNLKLYIIFRISVQSKEMNFIMVCVARPYLLSI